MATSGSQRRARDLTAEFGSFALILALCLSLLQAGLAVVARRRADATLAGGAGGAALAVVALVAVAFGCLILAFVTSDFSLANVAANSHTAKPMLYKVAAAWGSHEGSLLLWCLVLTGFGWSLSRGRGLPFGLRTSALAVQGLLGVLFLAFTVFTSNPFARLDPAPFQGSSLNPLLQDPALAFHPPFLYLGYVGLSVPFSLGVAALIEGPRQAGLWTAWGRWVRPWVLASWAFLTVGITLGSFWAYYELGWGGWWFWDPVENASFMPWLAATALLHSAIVTERRGALAGWTVFLSILAFSLSMLGAFLVRSGVLTSVHAFAVDPKRGLMLLAILGFAAGSALALFAWRAPSLAQGGLFRPVSREGGLVANNLFLTTATATVLIGTLYPLLLEAATGQTISVGPPYFALTFVPLMALALVLVPIGPLLSWKRARLGQTLPKLKGALVVAALAGLGCLIWIEPRNVLAALGMALGMWLIAGALAEPITRARLFERGLVKGERGRRLKALPLASWGMLLAHAGLGVFALGAVMETGYRQEVARNLAVGSALSVGGYEVTLDRVQIVEGPNYLAEQGSLTVRRTDGRAGRAITAERRFFPVGGQTTTEVGLDLRGLDDVYVVLGERGRDGQGQPAWSVRVWFNPWARLIFVGPLLMATGAVLSLFDRRLRLAPPGRRFVS